MRLTPWMLTVSAFLIVCLLSAAFLFKKLTAREITTEPQVAVRSLPMATSDIEAGSLVTRAHLGNGPWRNTADLSPDTFTSIDGVVGRIARERIPAATPLRGAQFYAPGDHPDLKVAPGMRAVTVNVGDDTAMVNGLIKPGQYVDVHMTVDRPASGTTRNRRSRDDAMTLTLFEGVRVVAMNRSYTQSTAERGHNVTLELGESQARVLLLAGQKGAIALTYNPSGPGNGGVQSESEQDRVTLQQLLGLTDDEPKPFVTEHYRSGGRATHYFGEDGRYLDTLGGGDAGAGDSGIDASPLHRGRDSGWFSGTNSGNDAPDVSRQTKSGPTL